MLDATSVSGRSWEDSPYMQGWYAALADSKAQIERMDRWRQGAEDEYPAGVETEYWKGLAAAQSFEVDEFRAGYLEKWKQEVELFSGRLFKQSGE